MCVGLLFYSLYVGWGLTILLLALVIFLGDCYFEACLLSDQ